MIEAEQMNDNLDSLPDRWRKILLRYAQGEDFRQAAKAEGCSLEYAKVLKTRMLKNPEAVKFLESIRTEGMKLAAYGLEAAMNEAKSDHDIAVTKGQMVAAVRATELRMKLSGLLVEQLHLKVEQIDLKGAMEAAKARVLRVLPQIAPHPQLEQAPETPVSVGSAHWERPRIPGNRPDSERAPVES